MTRKESKTINNLKNKVQTYLIKKIDVNKQLKRNISPASKIESLPDYLSKVSSKSDNSGKIETNYSDSKSSNKISSASDVLASTDFNYDTNKDLFISNKLNDHFVDSVESDNVYHASEIWNSCFYSDHESKNTSPATNIQPANDFSTTVSNEINIPKKLKQLSENSDL